MKIIITGGSGFVGSHTIKALKEKGYEIFNFDLKNGEEGFNWDIRNKFQLAEIIDKGDKVLHLAAIARFAEADKDPKLAFETNVIGTKNIAEVCEENGAERIVAASTGSVYMPIEQEPPITEDFPVKGNSVYACSKYIGELYIKEHKTPYIILRYGHLYGPGKVGHGLIGGFLEKIKRGLSPILYNGLQSNDFCYIKDIVQANILALESDKLNEVYNIGTGEELSAKKAGELICEIFKWKGNIETRIGRIVDPLRFVYNTSKAEHLLKFKAKYSFREGLLDMAKEISYNQSNDKATKK